MNEFSCENIIKCKIKIGKMICLLDELLKENSY